MAEETQRQSFSYFRQITQTLNWSTNLNFSCIFLIWNCVQREKLLCRIPHFRMHIFWLADIIIVVGYWRLLAGGGHTWGLCNILIQWIHCTTLGDTWWWWNCFGQMFIFCWLVVWSFYCKINLYFSTQIIKSQEVVLSSSWSRFLIFEQQLFYVD